MSLALITHPDMLDHRPGDHQARGIHPERPDRLAAVLQALEETAGSLQPIRASLAERADLERVHDGAYLDALEALTPAFGPIRLDPDTVLSAGSLRAARLAAGAVIDAVRGVAAGSFDRAFCAVRPPGHHALPGAAMGFCIFSNLAVGARAAQAAGFSRIAAIDFDVHHGNGTQAAFEAEPDLMLASVHQWPLYPGSGLESERGIGNLCNVTVPPGASRALWRRGFERLMAAVDAFEPDLVMISAGFDAHARDPLAEQSLEAEDFAWATRAAVSVARRTSKGRIVSTLEGGYDLEALGRSAAAHVRALQGG